MQKSDDKNLQKPKTLYKNLKNSKNLIEYPHIHYLWSLTHSDLPLEPPRWPLNCHDPPMRPCRDLYSSLGSCFTPSFDSYVHGPLEPGYFHIQGRFHDSASIKGKMGYVLTQATFPVAVDEDPVLGDVSSRMH
jgi:hypothetical protein